MTTVAMRTSTRTSSAVTSSRTPRSRCVAARATAASQPDSTATRRSTLAAGAAIASAALAAAFGPASPAQAFLGFGGASKDEEYATDTAGVIATVRTAVTLGRDDPGREAAVAAVRQATNSWVAKYRRDNQFSGKPSYGNTYSALNAVAGHYNSFGADTPLPKKRLDRVVKELDDADKLLARGR